MNKVIVRKCAPDGTPIFEYHAIIAERLEHGIRLTALWQRANLDLGYTIFETGDRFTEWFFTDRWYNILEVAGARDGDLKGWYCNVATPAVVGDGVVEYRDLYLDVWVAADGCTNVLDQEEFEAAILGSETRLRAQEGLRTLLDAINQRHAPFAALNRR